MISVLVSDWRERIVTFAHMVVASYATDNKPRSREIAEAMEAKHGAPRIDRDWKVQALGRAGEVGYCLGYGLDPATALDWSSFCDSGSDVRRDGRSWDVKTTGLRGRYLIWPVEKKHFFDTGCADMLVLALVGEGRVDLVGQVTRERFRQDRQTADDMHKLYTGTWFMDRSNLDEIDTPKRRQHYCHCGMWGTIANMIGPVETWVWQCNKHALAKQVEQREE